MFLALSELLILLLFVTSEGIRKTQNLTYGNEASLKQN